MPLNSTESRDPGNNLNVEQKNGHVMVHCHNEKLCSNENEAVLHDTERVSLKKTDTKGNTVCMIAF